MSKTLRTLDDYLDRSFVYSVLLNKAHCHYGRLKTLLKLPIIITSSVMSIVNSNIGGDNDETLKIVNITFNILTAVILGLSATFQIEQKHQNFLQSEKKFLKLCSKIEQKLLNENEMIHPDCAKEVINEYDMIVDNVDHNIPHFIGKQVHNQYATFKTLPMVINGVRKAEINRSPMASWNNKVKSLSLEESEKLPVMKPMKSSILFEKDIPEKSPRNTPVVIPVRPMNSHKPSITFEDKIEGLQECV